MSKTTMTKDRIRQILSGQIEEFFDSYVVIGRVAGSRRMVVMACAKTTSDHCKLNCAMASLMGAGASAPRRKR